MSAFARKQLEKYGWSKGKGLGKEENGITKPISAVLKLDTHGIGHDRLNVLASNWWCDAFNEASKRIKVVNTEAGVSLSHTKRKVVQEAPIPAGIRKKFIKEGKQKRNLITYDAVAVNSQMTQNLCSDAIYEKCDAVRNKAKVMKAKHKRVQKQEIIYELKSKHKRTKKG
ncbi:hypothetical protein JTE90_027444 [Oedothorax gibbosus]|uniref:G patch domain-containing protein 4 n=1 Tax=Oedothorax gibbosus TaxID=931172 RepID=A0AAV6W574_9ARAC|nr:hypothetical protein JTE90_027444 [Oedothorax gibbosus]